MSDNRDFAPQSVPNTSFTSPPADIAAMPGRIPAPIAVLVSVVLCGTYLLLPIERGFPSIYVLGYPITLTMLTTIASFVISTIYSNGRIPIVGWYVPLQVLFIAAMMISTIASNNNPQSSYFVILNYTLTFVINFIIFTNLFLNGYRFHFTVVLCITTTIASVLCLLEGWFRFYLPFYFAFFRNFDYHSANYQLIRTDFRAFGVLGNPIVSSVALSLTIPFVLDIKPKIKYVVVALIIGASILTASRTVLLIWAALLLGIIILSGRRRLTLLLLLLLMLLLLFVLPPDITDMISRPITAYLARDQGNIEVRQLLAGSSLTHFFNQQDWAIIFLGEGLKSSSLLAYTVGGTSTIDNTYMTVLVETGFIGFGAFAICCFAAILLYPGKKVSIILHWSNILGWLLAGLSFVTVYYATFNLLWVASMALLVYELQEARRAHNPAFHNHIGPLRKSTWLNMKGTA